MSRAREAVWLRYSAILLIGCALATSLAASRAGAGPAVALPAPERFELQRFFGGRTVAMGLAIYPTSIPSSGAKGPVSFELRGRLFQKSSELAVPVGSPVVIDFTQTDQFESIPATASIALPAVARETELELRVFARARGAEAWQPAGRIALRAYPSDVLAPLRRFAQKHRLRVESHDDGRLAGFLREYAIAFDASGDAPRAGSGPLVKLRVAARAGKALPAKFEPAQSDERVVLFHASALALPHLLAERTGRARRVTAPLSLLDRLASDPLAHETLLRIFELLEDPTP